MGLKRLTLLLTTALALPAAAQETALPEIALDEISVSASAMPVALGRTGASVSVMIPQSAPGPLLPALSALPGVSFSQTGGTGTTATLRLRGLPAQYVAVRFDGIDLTDPSQPQTQFNFGTLIAGGLSRIEVLQGAQSALYGANAIGGVVDITSWRPQTDGLSGAATVEGGSRGSWSALASTGIRGAAGEIALSFGRTRTDGISAAASGTEADGFAQNQVTAHALWDIAPGVRIGANGLFRDSKSDIDGFDAVTYLPADSLDTARETLRGGRVFAEFATGAVTHDLAFGRSRTSRASTDIAYADHYRYTGTRNTLSYGGHWDGGGPVALDWGAERQREDFVSASAWSDDRGKAETTSVTGEIRYAPTDRIDLSLALRRDDHNAFGARTTGRIAMAWRPTDAWVIRSVGATGYRAPSLYELYSTNYGNPDLKPETSTGHEIGAERLFEDGSVRVTYFRTRIKDRLDYDTTAWKYAQVPGTTRVKGIEVAARADLAADWTLRGSYTYTDAFEPGTTGSVRADRVPRNDLSLGVETRFARDWTGAVTVQSLWDTVENGAALKDYTLVGLSVGRDLPGGAQAYLRIENLFDADYETARHYSQPGRTLHLGLRATF